LFDDPTDVRGAAVARRGHAIAEHFELGAEGVALLLERGRPLHLGDELLRRVLVDGEPSRASERGVVPERDDFPSELVSILAELACRLVEGRGRLVAHSIELLGERIALTRELAEPRV